MTLFDTAHSYAGGASERFIGDWLGRQSPDTRGQIHLSTKVGNVVTDAGVRVDLSPRTIISQLSLSLERLGVGRVDFCVAHDFDAETPIESTLEGFAEAIESGLVAHIGASNINAEQMVAAMQASVRLKLPRYEWIQNDAQPGLEVTKWTCFSFARCTTSATRRFLSWQAAGAIRQVCAW